MGHDIYDCPQCDEQWVEQDAYREHLRFEHREETLKQWRVTRGRSCQDCSSEEKVKNWNGFVCPNCGHDHEKWHAGRLTNIDWNPSDTVPMFRTG